MALLTTCLSLFLVYLNVSPASADPASAGTLSGTDALRISLTPYAPHSTAWGTPALPGRTLILYDTTGTWGWLGQLYAMALGNLASHLGMAVAQPVVDYKAGEISRFTSVMYVGSTYDEPIPASFISDVISSSTPVLWMGDNAWALDSSSTAAVTAFEAKYGWDPSTSYFDPDTITSISYKGATLTRNALAGPIIGPNITNPGEVSVLATANCAAVCQSQARANGGSSFPYAISSANLTFVGEVPLSYITETDRYLVLADLVDRLINPTVSSHTALVRLEDVNVMDSPQSLLAVANYLHSQNVPFSINVIPHYMDPTGFYNNGVPVNIPLNSPQAKQFVATLKQMEGLGGTLAMEGYTHQYSTVANPYTGVSGDDFEFYKAQCSATQNAPYSFVAPCQNTDYVIEQGPLPGDSAQWAASRVEAGLQEMRSAGLGRPKLWVTPHYAASAADYSAFARFFGQPWGTASYDRRLYFGGLLSSPSLPQYSQVMGQFFPYTVHDLYGTTVIPENLGDYEPVAMNFHPPRLAADIVNEAQDNLVVRDGFASFFYDPSYGVTPLTQIVSGIKALGYTFAPALSLVGMPSVTTLGEHQWSRN